VSLSLSLPDPDADPDLHLDANYTNPTFIVIFNRAHHISRRKQQLVGGQPRQ